MRLCHMKLPYNIPSLWDAQREDLLLHFTRFANLETCFLHTNRVRNQAARAATSPPNNRRMRQIQKNNLRSLALLITVVCVFVVSLLAQPAQAKTEYREPAWTWCIFSRCDFGHFESPGAAIAAWNAPINQQYEQCLAGPRGAQCGGGCSKVIDTDATHPLPSAVVNGQPGWLGTATNLLTTYTTACGARPAQTYVQDSGGGIAVSGGLSCPDASWSVAQTDHGQVVIDGQTLVSFRQTCIREIPDAPTCPKPVFGDPISPIDQTQIESETDYSSPDGLLQVRRYYSSAGGGRWSWGDIGSVWPTLPVVRCRSQRARPCLVQFGGMPGALTAAFRSRTYPDRSRSSRACRMLGKRKSGFFCPMEAARSSPKARLAYLRRLLPCNPRSASQRLATARPNGR